MKKIYFLCLAFLFSLNLIFAVELIQKNEFNQFVGKELLGFAGNLIGNERINVYITKEDNSTFIVGVVTEDKKIKSISEGEIEKPTLKVYTDEKTLNEIQFSDDNIKFLKKAIDEKKISYKAVGFGKKIKFGFMTFFGKLFGAI